MIKVALTGGVASGKSTVAAMIRETGIPVIDSDQLARRVVTPGRPAWEAVRQNFGGEFFQKNGTLDRGKLAHLVFTHPTARRKLNQLLHPWIAQELQENLAQLQSQGVPLVVVEIPLLFELGLEGLYDFIIVVYANRERQKRRLARRDVRSGPEIEGILQAQIPLDQKIEKADFVVDNSFSIEETRQQVKKITLTLRKQLDK
ncbi:dephospho-CoA kinase [Desulfobacca acetoxidans]|jgi:dephospho-CoA kinase